MPSSRPLIGLLSDFGLHDWYVGVMKAAVLQHCPDANLIDITHDIPPQDILSGSVVLERAIADFPPGTVHLAVVDPGVGTSRRILITRLNDQLVVCPDNGLITWAWHLHPGAQPYELTWRPPHPSRTFHGRDVMAPVAGLLAGEHPLEDLARRIHDPILLDLAPARPGSPRARIIYIDRFGDLSTNLPLDAPSAARIRSIRLHRHTLGPLRSTYTDVAVGEPLSLIGSSGWLELAARNASAAQLLGVKVGDEIEIDWI